MTSMTSIVGKNSKWSENEIWRDSLKQKDLEKMDMFWSFSQIIDMCSPFWNKLLYEFLTIVGSIVWFDPSSRIESGWCCTVALAILATLDPCEQNLFTVTLRQFSARWQLAWCCMFCSTSTRLLSFHQSYRKGHSPTLWWASSETACSSDPGAGNTVFNQLSFARCGGGRESLAYLRRHVRQRPFVSYDSPNNSICRLAGIQCSCRRDWRAVYEDFNLCCVG